MSKKMKDIFNNQMVATLFITLGVVLSLLTMLQLGWLHLDNGYSSNSFHSYIRFNISLVASLYLASVVIWTWRNKERDIIPVVVALVTPPVTYILIIGAGFILGITFLVYIFFFLKYIELIVFLILFPCFLLLSIRLSFIFKKPKPSLKQERIKRIRLKAVIVLSVFFITQFVFSFLDIVPSKLRATKIAFVEGISIYSINANGSHLTKLTDGKNPAWSPDGEQIAFEFRSNKHVQIYRINGDGSGRVQLTQDSNNNNSDPTWSPDGEQIAFVSDRDGNKEIYVMNADGSNQKRLTNNPGSDLQPDWSPDGKSIAFVSHRDGPHHEC